MAAMARRMARYIFAAMALLSLLVCVAAVGLRLDHVPRPASRLIRVAGDVHLGKVGPLCYLSNRDFPYLGSMIQFREPVTRDVSGLPSSRWPVILVSVVRPVNKAWTWWTLCIDLDPTIGLASVFPLAWCCVRANAWRQHRRARRRQRALGSGLCPRCGYDLRASEGRCPECGEPLTLAKFPEASQRL